MHVQLFSRVLELLQVEQKSFFSDRLSPCSVCPQMGERDRLDGHERHQLGLRYHRHGIHFQQSEPGVAHDPKSMHRYRLGLSPNGLSSGRAQRLFHWSGLPVVVRRRHLCGRVSRKNHVGSGWVTCKNMLVHCPTVGINHNFNWLNKSFNE